MGHQTQSSAVVCLNGSFWTWETLETAVRGNVRELTLQEFNSVTNGFTHNFKGSKDLYDELQKRICFEAAEIKM